MADKSTVALPATSPARTWAKLFWTALAIVQQWQALGQELIAAFERACPGSEEEWDQSPHFDPDYYPLEVSPPTLELVTIRNQVHRIRQRLLIEWLVLRSPVCAAGVAHVAQTFDDGQAANDLKCLMTFLMFGTRWTSEAETAGASRLLTALARSAEDRAIDDRPAELAREFNREGAFLDASIILCLATATEPMDTQKKIGQAIRSLDRKGNASPACRASMSKLQQLELIVIADGSYALTDPGRRVAALLTPPTPCT